MESKKGTLGSTMKPLSKTPIPLFLIGLLLGLLPKAQAVDPAPDGGYPGGNTAEGFYALFSLDGGKHNTALGDSALKSVRFGNNNTATGYFTLRSNIIGNQNTATGALALANNTGSENTATGFQALLINTTGSQNTATGQSALERNSTGNNNTATGLLALYSNSTGSYNTATGQSALERNSTGNNNTAIGYHALIGNMTGSNNTAIGYQAGINSTTGENNVYLGKNLFGFPGESNHTYIRNINITSISGGNADTVTVDLATGLLGHLSSSRRYKQNIKTMDNTSEALYRLHPVTFHYKKDIDRTESLAFGLVAEEVAQVNPVLVAHDANGQPESIHYEMVNAMLLNEFLKEHKKVEEQQATITELKKELQARSSHQQQQIDALTAGLQKVSAQLEASKSAAQVALNNQ